MSGRQRISRKAAAFTESVIREMTREALRHGAVNLAQGFPDFPAPEGIKRAAVRASVVGGPHRSSGMRSANTGYKPRARTIPRKITPPERRAASRMTSESPAATTSCQVCAAGTHVW